MFLGGFEVEYGVSALESRWNKEWRTLGSVLVDLLTTSLFHLRGERDVVIQKLAVLDEG